MAKHLIDLDEDALRAARLDLRTTTIKDTVNEALRLAAGPRPSVASALDTLASADFGEREDAWH